MGCARFSCKHNKLVALLLLCTNMIDNLYTGIWQANSLKSGNRKDHCTWVNFLRAVMARPLCSTFLGMIGGI